MNTRRTCFRALLTMSALLLVGCSSGGNGDKKPPPPADTTPPVISLAGDNPQLIAVDEAYVELGATASDNVDGDLSASITIDASGVDISTPGDYLVTYNVTDAAGNVATTVTRTVTIPLPVPEAPTVSVSGDIKTLNFSWSEPDYVDYYRLMENPDGHSGFTQTGDDIAGGTLSVSKEIAVHLHDWTNALYMVQACNTSGCTDSVETGVADLETASIGYFKASDTASGDWFGSGLALSADGKVLVASARSSSKPGAAYIFRFEDGAWSQEALIRPGLISTFSVGDVALSSDGNTLAIGVPDIDSGGGLAYIYRFDGVDWNREAIVTGTGGRLYDIESGDDFGEDIGLSADGNTLIVGAENTGRAYVFKFDGLEWSLDALFTGQNIYGEDVAISADGNTVAIGSPWEDELSGAVYVFRFDGTDWIQESRIQAENGDENDLFWKVSLSADGNLLLVGARDEDSVATGIDGDENDNSATDSGAVYLYRYENLNWQRVAYIKASNGESRDQFGSNVVLSSDGNTIAVAATGEDSGATGVNGDLNDNSVADSAAVYLFRFDGSSWSQDAYVKATNPGDRDYFGGANGIALSADGGTLAVGAGREESAATGINGDQDDNSISLAGAVYVY